MPEVQSLVARRAATVRTGRFVLPLVLVAISLVVPVFPHPEWALSLVAPRAPTARPGGFVLALVLVAISLVVPNLPHPEWALPISHVPPIPKNVFEKGLLGCPGLSSGCGRESSCQRPPSPI